MIISKALSYSEGSSGVIPKALSSYLKTVDQNEPITYQWKNVGTAFIQCNNFFPHAALLRQSLLCQAKSWVVFCPKHHAVLVVHLVLFIDVFLTVGGKFVALTWTCFWTCFWQKSTLALPATSSSSLKHLPLICSHLNLCLALTMYFKLIVAKLGVLRTMIYSVAWHIV